MTFYYQPNRKAPSIHLSIMKKVRDLTVPVGEYPEVTMVMDSIPSVRMGKMRFQNVSHDISFFFVNHKYTNNVQVKYFLLVSLIFGYKL